MSSSPTLSSSTEPGPFSGMLDVTCRVEVIVGTGSISVRECLQLHRDSVIPLAQTAGADLQVNVQGVPTAMGEIVVDDETTSIRVTDVLPPPHAGALQ